VKGKTTGDNDMLEIIGDNIPKKASKVCAVRFEREHLPRAADTLSGEKGIDSDISSYIVEDLSREYLVLYPVARPRLFYEHLHTPGKFVIILTCKDESRVAILNFNLPGQPLSKAEKRSIHLADIVSSWPRP
jgi:hypothetical protein